MRRLAILGATGSIGESALQVAASLAGEIEVVALAANGNWERLADEAEKFNVRKLALAEERAARALAASGRCAGCEVLAGEDAAERLAADAGSDTVLLAVVGAAALAPAFAALRAGKRLAVASKEPIVMAGAALAAAAREGGGEILPVDSEHSGVFQCLACGRREEVRRIVLTSSGGALRDWPVEKLARATAADALRHPTWSMGKKVTVDSATLMNKALEIVEAHHLFDLPAGAIEVVIHPQSVVHALVEFADGNVFAQMAPPDMRLPIQHALTWPERRAAPWPRLTLETMRRLDFAEPERARYPALALGYRALAEGGTAGAAMNAANEVAVELFLADRIPFGRVTELVHEAMDAIASGTAVTIEAILEADRRARAFVRERAA